MVAGHERMSEQPPFSATDLVLLNELRNWASRLPAGSSAVREDHNPKYGGLLFEVTPLRPGTMNVTVGLGASEGFGFFWGEYGWEDWMASPGEVIDLCEAIREGDVIEETWKIGSLVVERRCYMRPYGERIGSGSYPIPNWIRRWARLSVRAYQPWS